MAIRAYRAFWTECMECSSPRCEFFSGPRLTLISAIPLGISWKWAVCLWTKCHLVLKVLKQAKLHFEKNYTSQPSRKAVWTSQAADNEAFLLFIKWHMERHYVFSQKGFFWVKAEFVGLKTMSLHQSWKRGVHQCSQPYSVPENLGIHFQSCYYSWKTIFLAYTVNFQEHKLFLSMCLCRKAIWGNPLWGTQMQTAGCSVLSLSLSYIQCRRKYNGAAGWQSSC